MFNQYPYLNLNDLNLDYILKAIKEMRYEVTNFVSINAIKYADPIQWNITSQYEKNTIAIDPVTGTAYISVAPVPAGVALTRPEYWTVVFDLQSFVTKANQNLANNYEEQTTTTATMNTSAGDWVIWGDVLYKALINITAGDAYVVGSNIERLVIEDVINAITQSIANEVQARQDADTALSDRIDDEVQARQDADTALQDAIDGEVQARQDADGNLDDLNTTEKSNLVGAINEVNEDLANTIEKFGYVNVLDYGAVGDGVTDDSAAFQSALDTGKHVYVPFDTGLKYLIANTIYLNTVDQSIFSMPTRTPFGGSGQGCILGTASPVLECNKKCALYNLNFRARADGVESEVAGSSAVKINMVDTVGSVDSKIDNCIFYCYHAAISVYGRQMIVSNCLFITCNGGLRVYYDAGAGSDANYQGANYGGRGIRFVNNQMHHEGYAVIIDTGNVIGAQILDNLLDIGGSLLRVQSGATFKHSLIANNIIMFSTWTPFAVQDNDAFQYNTISGNRIEFNSDVPSTYQLFGANSRNISGCQFIANYIANSTTAVLSFAASSDIVIIGNTFNACATAVQCTSGACSAIVMSNNIVINATNMMRAPSASTLSKVVVKGNTGTYTNYIDGNYVDSGDNMIEGKTSIADISAAPTMTDFNNLLSALRKAGVLHY